MTTLPYQLNLSGSGNSIKRVLNLRVEQVVNMKALTFAIILAVLVSFWKLKKSVSTDLPLQSFRHYALLKKMTEKETMTTKVMTTSLQMPLIAPTVAPKEVHVENMGLVVVRSDPQHKTELKFLQPNFKILKLISTGSFQVNT